MPANSGPVIVPRMLQGATRIWELFRMRLYFPESLRVITNSLLSSCPNHTGVRTGLPSRRNEVNEMYFCP